MAWAWWSVSPRQANLSTVLPRAGRKIPSVGLRIVPATPEFPHPGCSGGPNQMIGHAAHQLTDCGNPLPKTGRGAALAIARSLKSNPLQPPGNNRQPHPSYPIPAEPRATLTSGKETLAPKSSTHSPQRVLPGPPTFFENFHARRRYKNVTECYTKPRYLAIQSRPTTARYYEANPIAHTN